MTPDDFPLVTIIEAHPERRVSLDDLAPYMLDPPAPPVPRAPRGIPLDTPAAGDRPGDRFNASTTPEDVLIDNGWQLHHVDHRSGERHYTRPGKNVRDGQSATVYPDGHACVWTDATELEPKRWYDAFGLYAELNHRGSFVEATAAVRALGYGPPPRDPRDGMWHVQPPPGPGVTVPGTLARIDDDLTGWERTDLTDVLADGYEAPRPTILERADGVSLLYAGRINALNGESGGGKSWIAQVAAAQQITAGHRVIYIDLEDHAASLAARLRLLGVDDAAIIDRLIYISPTRAAGGDAVDLIARHVTEDDVTLVVIDSVGEAMALQLMKQNDDDDVARWFRFIPRGLAALGPCVTLIDHVPKDNEGTKLYAIGSQRKRAAIDGVAYRVDTVVPFSTDKAGAITLTVAKDRNGTFPTHSQAAYITVSPAGERLDIALTAPAARDAGGGVARPTFYMQRVSEYLEGGPARSSTDIETNVTGKAQHIRKALAVLVDEGFVKAHQGSNRTVWHQSIKPFRQDDEPASPSPAENGQSVPVRPPVVPGPSRSVPMPGTDPQGRSVPSVPDPPYGGSGGTDRAEQSETPEPTTHEHDEDGFG
jgi:hypothetical protein